MAEEKENQNQDAEIVIDHGRSKVSDLWKLEDYWAIWLGFIILFVGLIIYLPEGSEEVSNKIDESNGILQTESKRAPFKTIAWYTALDSKAKLKATSTQIGKDIKELTGTPKSWNSNPLDAFLMGEEESNLLKQNVEKKYIDAKDTESKALVIAQLAEDEAAAFKFSNEELNIKAVTAIDNWRTSSEKYFC